MYSRNTGVYPGASAANSGPSRFKKNYNLQCDFCKMKGHIKDNCYKLIGYPQDRLKKKNYGNSNGQYSQNKQNSGAAYNFISDELGQVDSQ